MKHLLTITDKDITGSEKLSTADPRIAVNAVLFDFEDNIALSYMGKYNLHTLPGGGVDPGEDLHSAVKREIWEETGCDCEIIGELGQISENRSEHDFTQERYYYLARVVGEKGELHLTDEEINENTTVVWHPLAQAFNTIFEKQHDNYQRKFIQKRDITVLTEALMWLYTHDVPGYDKFNKIEPIFKGLSSDKKYYIETTDCQRLLLRVNDIAKHDRKKAGYERMQLMDAAGVPVPHLLDVGLCNNGKSYYLLTTWFDGENIKKALPLLSETEQYVTGLKVGAILRKIHTVPAPENIGEWHDRYIKVISERIQAFLDCGVRFDGWENIIRYYQGNCCLLKNRPQTCLHGDFHAENLLLAADGAISVIDWQICDFEGYGDPWDDFRSDQCEASPHFATGCINGYFDNKVPAEFWKLNALYMAVGSITSIPWAYYRYPSELEPLIEHNLNVLRWFDNMKNPVPTWYLKASTFNGQTVFRIE